MLFSPLRLHADFRRRATHEHGKGSVMHLSDNQKALPNTTSLLKQHATTPLARSATLVHALCLSHLSQRRRTSSSFRHRRVRRSECVRWQFASCFQHTIKKSSLHTNSSSVNLICEEKHLPCSKQARLLREVNSIFLQRSSATRV